MPSDPKITDSQYRKTAMRLYGSDDIEIDETSVASRTDISDGGDDGAWVKAWVWVTNEDAKKE